MKGTAYRMVVEGHEDKFALIELMGHHIEWPNEKVHAPVKIEIGGSADEILAIGFISGKLKESGVEVLGVVLDADDIFAHRWNRIRTLCTDIFQNIPTDMPHGGLIIENGDGMRLGVWIMPDNASHGMLETFLKYLVPDDSEPVMRYARQAVEEARNKGATCRECHIDKALIHTWLAWQDPPGQPLGRALTMKLLNPHCDSAVPFVVWFRQLYSL